MKNILRTCDAPHPCPVEVMAGANPIKGETVCAESAQRNLPLQISRTPVCERAMPATSAFALPIWFEETAAVPIADMARPYTVRGRNARPATIAHMDGTNTVKSKS